MKQMTIKYAVVIENGPTSYGAHMPDLPGCVAAAESGEETFALLVHYDIKYRMGRAG